MNRKPLSACSRRITYITIAVALLGVCRTWGGPLADLLLEYEKLSMERKIERSDYRAWYDRIERAVRDDRTASRDQLCRAKIVQFTLAGVFEDYEAALRLADEAAELAPSEEGRFLYRYQGALAMSVLHRQKTANNVDDQRLLDRLLDLRRTVEAPGGLLERTKVDAAWPSSYVATLAMEANLRRERREFAEAMELYLRADRYLSENKWPTASENLEGQHATWLFRAALCAAELKVADRVDAMLKRLADLKTRNPMHYYVLELANAEDPGRGQAYQSRLDAWLRQADPTDPSWLRVVLALLESQRAREETMAAGAETCERILKAAEKQKESARGEWLSAQCDCWYSLALFYANASNDRSPDLRRSKDYARKYLAAHKSMPVDAWSNQRAEEMRALLE